MLPATHYKPGKYPPPGNLYPRFGDSGQLPPQFRSGGEHLQAMLHRKKGMTDILAQRAAEAFPQAAAAGEGRFEDAVSVSSEGTISDDEGPAGGGPPGAQAPPQAAGGRDVERPVGERGPPPPGGQEQAVRHEVAGQEASQNPMESDEIPPPPAPSGDHPADAARVRYGGWLARESVARDTPVPEEDPVPFPAMPEVVAQPAPVAQPVAAPMRVVSGPSAVPRLPNPALSGMPLMEHLFGRGAAATRGLPSAVKAGRQASPPALPDDHPAAVMGARAARAIEKASGSASRRIGALGEAALAGAGQLAPMAAGGVAGMKTFMGSAAHGAHASLMDAIEHTPVPQIAKEHSAPIRRGRNATPPPIPPEHYPTGEQILEALKGDARALRDRVMLHPTYVEAIHGFLGDALQGLRGTLRDAAMRRPLDGMSPAELAQLLSKLGGLKK